MPMFLSAMLIASPMPRVPPVTIATRAMMISPDFCYLARFRVQTRCQQGRDGTKKRSGSERRQPDIGHYLAIERACQGVPSSHPKGKALPALRFVEMLDR